MMQRCPICGKMVGAHMHQEAGVGRFLPFCSERCKLIDLGAWLDAEYRIATKPDEEDSDELKDAAGEQGEQQRQSETSEKC